jgi:ABC-type polysaccharide/polyol phosphate transport system ATPase subunit
MQARLAFATSVCFAPDILLVDEVLAVGDAEFRERCFERLHQLRNGGKTLLVVSHDFDTVIELCSRAVWLDKGVVREQVPAREDVEAYRSSIA